MKNILVTGAAGFIGSNLVESLVEKGYKVKAFIHYNSQNNWGNLERLSKKVLNEIEIFTGNIEDPFAVKKSMQDCDTVLHLAALIGIPYSYIAPESYVNTNIKGTLNVMQAALDTDIEKVVHTSTSETYGTAIYAPIDEKHPLQGQSPYSASKIGADKIAESYYLSFELPVATIRPFNTFGPRQSARAVIPTIISQALTTKENTIKLGSLSPLRDLTYVKDTANGFIKIAESAKTVGEVTNIGNGKCISIGDLANMIIEKINPSLEVIEESQRVRPEKSEVMKLLCDNTKAKNLAGWEPEYTLEEGIQETINFIKENLNYYKPEIYNV